MSLRRWSRAWFNSHYREDIYGYVEKRFIPIVREHMGGVKGVVLDAACGFGNPYIETLGLKNTIGTDIDLTVKNRNKLHEEFIIGDLHYLNTKQRFEGIISVSTWEHLHSPKLVLENFFKVLSDKGILIIIAPNRWNYISVIERLLPKYLKDIAWRILKGRDHMPYPAYYRLCSKKTLSEAARHQGFAVEHSSSIEVPPLWFAKVPPLFILACLWMSLVNKYKVLENISGAFIVVLKKE